MRSPQSQVVWRAFPGACFGILLALFIVFGTGCSDSDDDSEPSLVDAPAPMEEATNASATTNAMTDVGAPPAATGPATAAVPDPIAGRVLVVGDSITVGFGVENWVDKLFRIVPRNYLNVGSNGLRSDQAANRFEDNWMRHTPELVLLLIGTNDALGGRPDRALEGIQSIAAQARGFGSDIIIGTIPPLTGRRADENRFAVEINNGIRAFASANGIRVANVDSLFGPGGPRIEPSGSARIEPPAEPDPAVDDPADPADETPPGEGGTGTPGEDPTPEDPDTPTDGGDDPPPTDPEDPPVDPEPEPEPETDPLPLMSEAFLQSDGIHPNNAGQELITSAFSAQLQ